MSDLADRRLLHVTTGLALFLASVILYYSGRKWLAHHPSARGAATEPKIAPWAPASPDSILTPPQPFKPGSAKLAPESGAPSTLPFPNIIYPKAAPKGKKKALAPPAP